MKNIITDTNVWYEIGKNYELFPRDKNVELPLPVLFELFTTENLTRSENTFTALKLAVSAILDFKTEISFNHYSPIEFLIKSNFPEFETTNNVDNYLIEFAALRELAFEDCINVNQSHLRDVITDTTDYYNKVSLNYKEEIKKIGKSEFQKWNTLPKTQKIVTDLMNLEIESQKLNLPKIEDFDFTKVGVFINVFDKHLRDIALTGERLRDNDWNDIFLLTYVQQNSQYWSFEDKWNRKISELGFDDYLVK